MSIFSSYHPIIQKGELPKTEYSPKNQLAVPNDDMVGNEPYAPQGISRDAKVDLLRYTKLVANDRVIYDIPKGKLPNSEWTILEEVNKEVMNYAETIWFTKLFQQKIIHIPIQEVFTHVGISTTHAPSVKDRINLIYIDDEKFKLITEILIEILPLADIENRDRYTYSKVKIEVIGNRDDLYTSPENIRAKVYYTEDSKQISDARKASYSMKAHLGIKEYKSYLQ